MTTTTVILIFLPYILWKGVPYLSGRFNMFN